MRRKLDKEDKMLC